MDLTEQSLIDAILKLKQMADHGEITHPKPRHLLIPSHAFWFVDRLLNPWKGNRAKWLATKR